MEHVVIGLGEIHRPHNWEWADATARAAEVVTDTTLLNCFGLQLSDNSLWRLSAAAPAVWAAVAAGVAYSDITGTVPTWNQNTTGNAATATTASSVPYSGLTGTVPTWNQNTTGNAATATSASNVPYSGLTGTVPTWNQNTTGTAANVTGIVAVANGGTGTTTPGIVAGTNVTVSGTWPNQTVNATGNSGTVTSVSFTGGIVSIATATTTPAFTITGTSGGIPYFSSASTWATSAALAANALVIGGGAGAAPATTTTATGALTFLGTPTSANLAALLTDETGSGSAVFATSPTLVTPILGTPTSGNLSNCTVDGTDQVGFKNIPQNAQTGSYTMVLADSGKHIYHASGAGAATYTIPAASSVAYPLGTAITFVNLSATSISIAITTDTMYLSGAGSTGTRTLAQYGSATAIKVSGVSSSGIWVISGSGLT